MDNQLYGNYGQSINNQLYGNYGASNNTPRNRPYFRSFPSERGRYQRPLDNSGYIEDREFLEADNAQYIDPIGLTLDEYSSKAYRPRRRGFSNFRFFPESINNYGRQNMFESSFKLPRRQFIDYDFMFNTRRRPRSRVSNLTCDEDVVTN